VTAAANQLGSVEHIVVLVLENRSFDHMLGFLFNSRTAAWKAARANASSS
jgi:phospholipase C